MHGRGCGVLARMTLLGEESHLVSGPVSGVSGATGLRIWREAYPDSRHGTTSGEEVEHARTKLRHEVRGATLFCSVMLVAGKATW